MAVIDLTLAKISRTVPASSGTDYGARATNYFPGWLAVVALFVLQLSTGIPRRLAAAEAIAILAVALLLIARTAAQGMWSPQCIYLAVLGLFHLGLAPNVVLDIDPRLPASDYFWYQGELLTTAINLTTIAILSYTTAVLFCCSSLPRQMLRTGDSSRRAPKIIDEHLSVARAKGLSAAGSVVLLISVATWFVTSISAVGVGGLFGSYLDYLDATGPTLTGVTYLGMALGLALAVIRPVGMLSGAALLAFAVFACVGFILGLRGEVLFTVAAAVPVIARHAKMPGKLATIAATMTVLIAISLARGVRDRGLLNALQFGAGSASPLDALVELGTTLRVVAVVSAWHEAGEPFRHGDTYTVVMVRFLEGLDSTARLAAERDFRLFNSEIASRVGLIGGSTVAEAYHNFAIPGVVVVSVLLGGLFAYFGRGQGGVLTVASYAVVAGPLFNHIRNTFVTVVPAVGIGLVVVGFVVFVTPRTKAGSERLRGRK